MAFGPSILFTAPSWEPNVTRTSATSGRAVPVEPLHAWLRSLGFQQHPGAGANFTFGSIDVFVHQVDEEVAFLNIEFGLVNDAPDRLSEWQSFAQQLCERWGFSLADSGKCEKVPLDQFRRLLAQDRTWQLVAKVNGWASIWSPDEQSQSA